MYTCIYVYIHIHIVTYINAYRIMNSRNMLYEHVHPSSVSMYSALCILIWMLGPFAKGSWSEGSDAHTKGPDTWSSRSSALRIHVRRLELLLRKLYTRAYTWMTSAATLNKLRGLSNSRIHVSRGPWQTFHAQRAAKRGVQKGGSVLNLPIHQTSLGLGRVGRLPNKAHQGLLGPVRAHYDLFWPYWEPIPQPAIFGV